MSASRRWACCAWALTACASDALLVAPAWPRDHFAAVLTLDADGNAETVDLVAPGATLDLPIRDNRRRRLLAYTYASDGPPGLELSTCGLRLGGEEPPLVRRDAVYETDLVDLGAGQPLDFRRLDAPGPELPAVSYARCDSDPLDCETLAPNRAATSFADLRMDELVAVSDDVVFFAVDGHPEDPAFRLFRLDRRQLPSPDAFVQLAAPSPTAREVESLAFDGQRVHATSTDDLYGVYSTDGELLEARAAEPGFTSVAASPDLRVFFGGFGLKAEPIDRVAPLAIPTYAVHISSPFRVAAVTAEGLHLDEGSGWRVVRDLGSSGVARYRVGGDADVLVLAHEDGQIQVRDEVSGDWREVVQTDVLVNNLRGVVGLGLGRWLVTGEDGTFILQSSARLCVGQAGLVNNLREASRSPSGRVVWIGTRELPSVLGDTPPILWLELP